MVERGNTNQIVFEESKDSLIRETPTSISIVIRTSGDSLVHEPTSVVNEPIVNECPEIEKIQNKTMLMLKRNLYHLKNLKK
jgi:hypothetical protein